MLYAEVSDVQARMTRELSNDELALCETLLEDASVMIDIAAPNSPSDARRIAACRMVIRALGDGNGDGYPIGASQGSVSALGYTQQWTLPQGSGTGELYIGKTERQLLGIGNRIGSYSPAQNLVPPEAQP